MPSSGMLCHVALVRTDVLKECIASIIRVGGTGELVLVFVFLCRVLRFLVTAKVPSSPILVTLMTQAIGPTNTLVLTSATWHNIPEDGILSRLYLQFEGLWTC
jgi:hypothetical protein